MSAKILSAVLTKRASRKTAMNAGTAALLGMGIGGLGGAAVGGNMERTAMHDPKLQAQLSAGGLTPNVAEGASVLGAAGAAAGGVAGLGVYGAAKLLEHLMHEHHHPKMASDYCPPGVIKAEPATNMTKMPPTNVKTTTVKTAARPSILTRIGKIPGKLYDAASPLLNKTVGRTDLGNELLETMERNPGKTKLLAATGLAGTGTLAATGHLHPVNATEALFAGAPPKPTGLAQILDQAKDKAQGLLSGAKDFAGGFAQSPMKWDTAHALTAGGVALGGAALLAHVLHKKRTPAAVADEQELAEA